MTTSDLSGDFPFDDFNSDFSGGYPGDVVVGDGSAATPLPPFAGEEGGFYVIDPNTRGAAPMNGATRLEVPILTIIKREDPTFFRDRRDQLEYEFSRRSFHADPMTRGAYGQVVGPDDFFRDFNAGCRHAGERLSRHVLELGWRAGLLRPEPKRPIRGSTVNLSKLSKLLPALVAGFLCLTAQAATIVVKDANGQLQSVGALPILGQAPMSASLPFTLALDQPALHTICDSGCSGGGGGSSAITTWAGGTLGAITTYGSSPGAVLVPAVNAFVTNPVAVTGTFWQATQPVSAASLPLPALAATSTKQSDGSQKTQIVDGTGAVISSTSNNLNVQCANCTGSGVSAADEASFTAGTSLFASGGGFFQVTPTNNPLTNGQQGGFQVTAQRALFTNLRNASGTEIGTSTTPLQVSLANTGANATAVKVDNSAVTQPISASALPLPTGASTAANQTAVQGSFGSATPATGMAVGASSSGNLTPFIQADASAPINVSTSTTTQIVALVSAKAIYVTGFDVIAAGTGNITFEYGTGSNCGTGTTVLTGAYNLTAQAGLARGGAGVVWKIPASNALCVVTSAAVQMSGSVSYTQF
jgi:hypothetical protein